MRKKLPEIVELHDETTTADQEKHAQCIVIQNKMNQVNGINIDISDEEIEELQSLVNDADLSDEETEHLASPPAESIEAIAETIPEMISETVSENGANKSFSSIQITSENLLDTESASTISAENSVILDTQWVQSVLHLHIPDKYEWKFVSTN